VVGLDVVAMSECVEDATPGAGEADGSAGTSGGVSEPGSSQFNKESG
jgi:hypothetical protein